MQFVQPSGASDDYNRHSLIIKWTEQQPENTSFKVMKAEQPKPLKIGLLRRLAELVSVGKKVIVVIEHSDCYEVHRMYDGSNAKLFYQSYTVKDLTTEESFDIAVEKVKGALRSYLLANLEDCLSYDPRITEQMKNSSYVTLTYLQRKLCNIVVFKNNEDGAGELLRKCIGKLKEDGTLSQIPEEAAQRMFQTITPIYAVIRLEMY